MNDKIKYLLIGGAIVGVAWIISSLSKSSSNTTIVTPPATGG